LKLEALQGQRVLFLAQPLIEQYLDGLGFSVDRIHKLLYSIVKSADKGGEDKGSLFLNQIYALMKVDLLYIKLDHLIGNIITLFIASTNAMGKTQANCLYLLEKDKALKKQLQAEADGLDLEQCTLDDLYLKMPHLNPFFTKSIVFIVIHNYS